MPRHDEHNKKVIGERLNTLLAVKNLKQKDIADLLGVTENTVSYYVTGARCPNTDQIIAIAKKWNVSADYLLGLSDVMSTDQNKKIACEVTGLTEENVNFLAILKKYQELRTYALEHNYAVVRQPDANNTELTYSFTINMLLSNFAYNIYHLDNIKKCFIRYKRFFEDKGKKSSSDIDENINYTISKKYPDLDKFLEDNNAVLLTNFEARRYTHENMATNLGKDIIHMFDRQINGEKYHFGEKLTFETLQGAIDTIEHVIEERKNNPNSTKPIYIFWR